MRALYLSFLVLIAFGVADEFSAGPYGIEYFDTAGPFVIQDLNTDVAGDINFDDIINIQDVIVVIGHIMGNIDLADNQYDQGNLNADSTIDILDVVILVGLILDGAQGGWSFENNWTGEDSYIFIHLQSSAATSTALWNSNTKGDLLESSPMNVHYFFLSSTIYSDTDVANMKAGFDEIIATYPEEMQNHWNSHLHFVPSRSLDLDSWLAEALNGKAALAIDQSQRLRETGFLGTPSGNFTGTYLSYLAHEAIYFDYEFRRFNESAGENYDEIVVFDRDHYTGWWASSITKEVEFPSNLDSYSKMEVELIRGCADCGLFNGGQVEIECGEVINYTDDGCDPYDRIAHMAICEEDGSGCYEIARWITPFGRQPISLTDITPFIASLRSGSSRVVKFQESGWPNSLLTLKFRFYHGDSQEANPKEIIPLWNGTVGFNPDYSDNRPPQTFSIPPNAEKVEFVSFLTGHGWSCNATFQCAEFCNSRHEFSVNGGEYNFSKAHPTAGAQTHCMDLETIAQGVIPNQGGTWGYGRAGWCPGQEVKPYVVDISDGVILGDDNIIEYDACRVNGNSCVTPPVCSNSPDGCYCPEIAFSSYIVISY